MTFPMVRIGDITNPINGKTFKSSEWTPKGLPIIRIQNLKNPDAPFNFFAGYLEDKYRVVNGDLLFAWSGTPGTSFGAFIWNRNEAALNQHIFKLPIENSNCRKYLCYALNFKVAGLIEQAQGGVGLAHITKSKFVETLLPLPDLQTQTAIANKIDSIFSEIDAGVEELKRTQENLALYKQSILNAAIQGKLVPQDPNDEPASKLLERIRMEKEKLIKAGKLKKQKPLPPIDPSEMPFELPKGWEWVRLGDPFEVFVGSTPSRDKKAYWGGSISWVSSGEVAFCEINKTKESITELGLKNTSCTTHPPGTIMLGMIGEGKTRGQAAILRIHATHNQNTAAIRVENTGCCPEYLYWFLVFNYEATRRIGSGNNQKALNKERIRNFLIPLPPTIEQKRIVKMILVRLGDMSSTLASISKSMSDAQVLKQSILKSAFEGILK